ncbi:MAG: hypothetical protein O9333_03910 [Beijerinckiaceae bacterium]|jgi:hypothetical protein|nr:hypothetical protein [Beijerinckiaceae bacterium]
MTGSINDPGSRIDLLLVAWKAAFDPGRSAMVREACTDHSLLSGVLLTRQAGIVNTLFPF